MGWVGGNVRNRTRVHASSSRCELNSIASSSPCELKSLTRFASQVNCSLSSCEARNECVREAQLTLHVRSANDITRAKQEMGARSADVILVRSTKSVIRALSRLVPRLVARARARMYSLASLEGCNSRRVLPSQARVVRRLTSPRILALHPRLWLGCKARMLVSDVTHPIANSSIFVLPTITAPASSRNSTTAASNDPL